MNVNAPIVRVEPQETAPSRRDRDGLHKRRGIWHYKLKIAGKWREFTTKTKNYAEARKTRQKALQDQAAGTLPTDLAKAKLSQVAPQYLSDREKLVAPKTARIDRDRVKPLLKAFGAYRLGDISSDDLRRYQVERRAKVGPRTINLEVKVLRGILRSAKLWARIADDYKPLTENTRGPGRALSDEEEKRLFSVARSNPRWEAAYYAALLASNTTARGCELKGLRLADVDLMEGAISIRRVSTKTDAGCRVVPLNETALWAAGKLFERARKLGAVEPEHYLFPACQNGHVHPTNPQTSWRTAWRSLTAKADLKGLRFHDLRHHAITRLAEAGVPEQTLMALAGHVTRSMLEHYSHIRTEAKRDAVKAIVTYKPAEPVADEVRPVN